MGGGRDLGTIGYRKNCCNVISIIRIFLVLPLKTPVFHDLNSMLLTIIFTKLDILDGYAFLVT